MSEIWRYFKKILLAKRHKAIKSIYPQLEIFNFNLIGRNFICDGFFDKENLEFLKRRVFPQLGTIDICLDIGEKIGNHSVFYAKYFTDIYAFEPNLRAFKLLEANTMLKNNIQAFNFGLSNRKHSQSANFDAGNVGSASLVHKAPDGVTVQFNLD